VKSLKDLEYAWFLCKEHLTNQDHLNDLAVFSKIIHSVCQRYPVFKMQVENCDPQVFLTLPALVILNGLERIVRRFAPKIMA
jgi:hypothetical protein